MDTQLENICAIWELDLSTVRTLRSLLYGSGPDNELLGSFHPHITLANYPKASRAALLPYARDFAAQTEAFRVDFASIGLLSPQHLVCFPRQRGGLNENFVRFHERFDEQADQWTSLNGGKYRPHVSLYAEEHGVDTETVARIQRNFSGFSGHVVALSLSLVQPQGFLILATYPLLRHV